IADKNGVSQTNYTPVKKHAFCVFEKLYFSHETSMWHGFVIGENRNNLGAQLAKEEAVRVADGIIKKDDIENIDYVVAVPDTARPGALTFYETLKQELSRFNLKMVYTRGLVKERYDWARRTFIEDDPYLRERQIEKKFFVSPSIIGKSIYLIDDTGVRLNTYKILVKHLLEIGVREIHCRFLAPRFVNPCFLGVNIGSRDELGAVDKNKKGQYRIMSQEEIQKNLKVASLYYLSLEGLAASLEMTVDQMHASHCSGCLDYNNPFDMSQYDPEYRRTPYASKKS
ncbi:MAG: hypothetical protein ACD_57C00054G0006, partial [uncultured bacterium]